MKAADALRVLRAVAVSFALHAAAVCAAVFFAENAENEIPASLEMSSVELSFSEEPQDDAKAVNSVPSAPSPPQASKPEQPPPPEPPPPAPEPEPARPAPEPVKEPERKTEPEPSSEPEPPQKPEPAVKPPPPPPPPPPLPPPPPPPPPAPPPPAAPPAAPARPSPPPAPAAPAPVQEKVVAKKLPSPLNRVKPRYPVSSRERGEQGDTFVEIEISRDGKAESVRVSKSSGYPELDKAALAAARRMRFRPAEKNGRRTPSKAILPVRFRLDGR